MVRLPTLVAGLAMVVSASAANALVITPEPGSNLAEFSYEVDDASRTINIFETFGPGTAQQIVLRFEDFDFGRRSWVVVKTITNQTRGEWTSFSHELLQSDLSGSGDRDGLSFAQFGSPLRPRTSSLFTDVEADELAERDYLLFSNGVVAIGDTVTFTFGLAAFRDTPETSTFFLRQSEFLNIIPEPATWAMMIAGFGMVGFSMRRRSSRFASVTA